jgi:hypothetical protein
VVAEIAARGGTAAAVPGDVTDEAASDCSSRITGATLDISGGRVIV